MLKKLFKKKESKDYPVVEIERPPMPKVKPPKNTKLKTYCKLAGCGR